ncbi:hypothetical protein [Streptomyces xiamenensis]|uniref:hypothetical protein n=1 Tax=Streptomyces xiamenensis TaxID=408015 RepID=UPI0037CDADB6
MTASTIAATTVLRALAAAGITDPARTAQALDAAGLLTPTADPAPAPASIDITVLSLIDGSVQTVTLTDYYTQDIDGEHKIAGRVDADEAVIGPVVIKVTLPDGTRIFRSAESQMTKFGFGRPYLAMRSHSATGPASEAFVLGYNTALGAVEETRSTYRRAQLDINRIGRSEHATDFTLIFPRLS